MLKRAVSSVVVAVAMTAATLAQAGEATGSIKAVDEAAHTLTLLDGRVFTFDPTFDLSRIGVTFRVRITYTAVDDVTNRATALNVIAFAEIMLTPIMPDASGAPR